MRLPTFRIVDLLEWVVALAVGFATFRACLAVPNWRSQWEGADRAWTKLTYVVVLTLVGITIVEGLALAVERARGRGPRPWGIGRWTWSMASIYLVLKVAFDLMRLVLTNSMWRRASWGRAWHEELAPLFIYSLASVFRIYFAFAMAAFLVTVRLAGSPSDPAPDAREWSGRVFAVFVVVWPIASNVTDIFVN